MLVKAIGNPLKQKGREMGLLGFSDIHFADSFAEGHLNAAAQIFGPEFLSDTSYFFLAGLKYC